jgi:hypothetical protein
MSGTLLRLGGPSDSCSHEPEVTCLSRESLFHLLARGNASSDPRQSTDACPEPVARGGKAWETPAGGAIGEFLRWDGIGVSPPLFGQGR